MFHDFFFKGPWDGGPFDGASELSRKRGPLSELDSHVNAFTAASAGASTGGGEGPASRMLPAHRAAWRGCPMELAEMAEEGGDMLCTDEAGNTAVHWAAIGQKADNLKHLLNQGHRIWSLNDKNQDVLSIALDFKDLATAAAILDHGNFKDRNTDAQTPPEYAGAKSGKDVLRILKEQVALDKAAKLKKLAHLRH